VPADIIIYAIVAVGLVFWLRSILGTRHGQERERPNPYTVSDSPAAKPQAPLLAGEDKPQPGAAPKPALGFAPGSIYTIENKTAENALLDIAEADKSFDLALFMAGASEAFPLIVEAFAAGDRATLESLLGKDLYAIFEKSIAARESAGETLQTKIHAIRKAEVTGAALEGAQARITVRFTADESSLHKDSEGRILSGDAHEPAQMIDIWTFTRDIRSDDPKWLLVETHSDDPDDNDIIPNSK
jgi:predicted lipid-binding transport protein (Tim44 family)